MNLKVPLDTLSHQFRRTQKIISKDLNLILDQLAQESTGKHEGGVLDRRELSARVQNLINIIENSDSAEKNLIQALENRIQDYLKPLSLETQVMICFRFGFDIL